MRTTALFPALLALRGHLEAALSHAMALRVASGRVDVLDVTDHIASHMTEWDPTIAGVRVIDPDTRAAFARGLAGVATNIALAADTAARRTA